MSNGFNIVSEGISIGGWYRDFDEARAALAAFVECGCSGLRIERCEEDQDAPDAPVHEPQEMTPDWVRNMKGAM